MAKQLSVAALLLALADGQVQPTAFLDLLVANSVNLEDALASNPQLIRSSLGPVLAPQWSANVSVSSIGSAAMSTQLTEYHYDSLQSKYRMKSSTINGLFHPNQTMTFDQLHANTSGLNMNITVGDGDDAICKPLTGPYSDPFALLKYSKKMGSTVVSGTSCDIWLSNISYAGNQYTTSACIGQNGVPLEQNQSTISDGRSLIDIRMVWHDVKVGPPAPDVFAPSKACAFHYPTEHCSDFGTVTLDVYRIHSLAEPFSLENRNIGDALGDMAFTCVTDGTGLGGGEGSVVSRWTVEVSRSFGQYGYCLYNRATHKNYCMGGTGVQVGRESALGLGSGHLQGQCSPNGDVGSWYSLPAAGHCPEGATIGAGGCSWGNEKRIRTVNASCIMQDRALKDVCKQEYGHAPFTKSTAIFIAALASSDASKGGCRDSAPPGVLIV